MTRKEKVSLYDKLITNHTSAERKGDTIPYTSLNGHMYSMLTKGDEVAIRLPEPTRVQFMEKYKTKPVEQYGVVQKEYVVVPDSLLKKTKELLPYFDLSYTYVSAMKPATKAGKKIKAE